MYWYEDELIEVWKESITEYTFRVWLDDLINKGIIIEENNRYYLQYVI